MARVKAKEYSSKKLLNSFLGKNYTGISVDLNADFSSITKKLSANSSYVVKVDQGIKKRSKQKLLFVDVSKDKVESSLSKIKDRGYEIALVEPYIDHDKNKERYISFELARRGTSVVFSKSGGVNVENSKEIEKVTVNAEKRDETFAKLNLQKNFIINILDFMQKYHVSFLEINPFVEVNGEYEILDLAVLVDSAGVFLANGAWQQNDLVSSDELKTIYEKNVSRLSKSSPASFFLKVLNTDGSIFALLSGGGASLVLADELGGTKLINKVANIGEYSGNPNMDETYEYAKNLIALLVNSKSKKKALLIAGGVANFTDIPTTFKGIMRVIDERKDYFRKQKVAVIVRRGGPNQQTGLAMLKEYLDSEDIINEVSGPELSLGELTGKLVKYIKD